MAMSNDDTAISCSMLSTLGSISKKGMDLVDKLNGKLWKLYCKCILL